MDRDLKRSAHFLVIAVTLIAAASPAAETNDAIDQELRQLIAANELTGDPSAGRELPTVDNPLAILGKLLFFSKALSGDLDVACASCHHPLLAGVTACRYR